MDEASTLGNRFLQPAAWHQIPSGFTQVEPQLIFADVSRKLNEIKRLLYS